MDITNFNPGAPLRQRFSSALGMNHFIGESRLDTDDGPDASILRTEGWVLYSGGTNGDWTFTAIPSSLPHSTRRTTLGGAIFSTSALRSPCDMENTANQAAISEAWDSSRVGSQAAILWLLCSPTLQKATLTTEPKNSSLNQESLPVCTAACLVLTPKISGPNQRPFLDPKCAFLPFPGQRLYLTQLGRASL